jgi:hypothetical protein
MCFFVWQSAINQDNKMAEAFNFRPRQKFGITHICLIGLGGWGVCVRACEREREWGCSGQKNVALLLLLGRVRARVYG